MLVIVEGPDGSGKSTLCENLKKKGYKVLRRERSAKNFTYLEFKDLQHDKQVYVIDRAILTPWAYRVLDGANLNRDDFWIIEAIMLLQNSPIIYCNCPNSFEYSMNRGEDNITNEKVSKKLRDIYEFIIKTLKLYNITTIFEYNFEEQSVEDVINFIKEVQ